jgi:hypothetical protein
MVCTIGEVRIELVQQAGVHGQGRSAAVHVDCPGVGQLRGGRWLEDGRHECRLRSRQGERRVRVTLLAGVQYTVVNVRAPRLVEIGESEVDPDVGIGGFVPITWTAA